MKEPVMRRRAGAVAAGIVLGALCVLTPWGDPLLAEGAAESARDALPELKGMTTVLDGRVKSVDWCAANNLIALGRWQRDGYVDVCVMRPDGTGLKRLTSKPGLCPQRHNGNPAWHPSGEFIVFTAQNEDASLGEDTQVGRLKSKSVPGTGLHCNLWVMRSDGSRAWQLTDIGTDYRAPRGVIHPQFSRDGKKLFWAGSTGQYPRGTVWGKWAMHVADFVVEDGVPRLDNVTTLQPGRQVNFYESHAFSPDGSKLLFCANCEPGQAVTGIDIYEYELASGRLTNLTRTPSDWDEHAHYSPDGRWIAWMSSTGMKIHYESVRGHAWRKCLKTDLWIMDSRGMARKRLTYFNKAGHPHHRGGRTIVSDSAWSPDGRRLVVLVAYESDSDGKRRLKSKLVMVELEAMAD